MKHVCLKKRTLITASFFYVWLLFPLQSVAVICTTDHYDQKVVVKKVIDGDTLELNDGRHVRFIGVNTPEKKRREIPAEPLADDSTHWLRNIIRKFDSRLFLRLGKEQQDHYGRTLAHPFLPDGKNLSALLLRGGKGFRVSIPPNLDFQDCYFAAEEHAYKQKLGIWDNAYFNVRPVSTLTIKDTGFRRVKGKVSRIGESRHAIWLNLGKGFAIRLAKDKLDFFKTSPRDYKDKLITLRGWVYYVKKRDELRINLYHPNMIEAVQPELKNQ